MLLVTEPRMLFVTEPALVVRDGEGAPQLRGAEDVARDGTEDVVRGSWPEGVFQMGGAREWILSGESPAGSLWGCHPARFFHQILSGRRATILISHTSHATSGRILL